MTDLPVLHGVVETRVTGRGAPVTVFAHGLASSIDETRPFASRVPGSRVFFHFRDHGQTRLSAGAWSYAGVAHELGDVAEAYDATRALGVSLGAGALLRYAADHPDAFERLVLVLPAAIDRPRTGAAVDRLRTMAALVEAGDVDALARAVLDGEPVAVRERPDAQVWARRRAERLSSGPVAAALREMGGQAPLEDRSQLARITCPVLVVSQDGDATHPAAVARELAGALSDVRLAAFDDRGLLWEHGGEVRRVVAEFLA